MKKTIYRADERGFTNHKWLKSYHTFNFANYYEEDRSGFGKLLVLNEDSVQPGTGFGTHRHDNVEIISIPLDGELSHKDDFGNESIIHKGEIQVISAGKGYTHSESNPSETELLHFLEIWILPNRINGEPRYQVRYFDFEKDKWVPIIHPDQPDGTLSIYQDACFCLGKFEKNVRSVYNPAHPLHGIFLMVLSGRIEVMEEQLHQYDAIALEGASVINIRCLDDSDILLIEIPTRNEGT
jgi:redox-sensitive bicupin YhaK (pirin superfamily)